MQLPLFADGTALLWLVISILVTFIVVYFPLFWLFFGLCRLDGSTAIRWSWTVGLLGLMVYLIRMSPVHARYLDFWTGSTGAELDCALLGIASLVFLIFIWHHRPHKPA